MKMHYLNEDVRLEKMTQYYIKEDKLPTKQKQKNLPNISTGPFFAELYSSELFFILPLLRSKLSNKSLSASAFSGKSHLHRVNYRVFSPIF